MAHIRSPSRVRWLRSGSLSSKNGPESLNTSKRSVALVGAEKASAKQPCITGGWQVVSIAGDVTAVRHSRLARRSIVVRRPAVVKQRLEIDEKALGPDHPTVAADYRNLAGLLQARASMTRPSRSIAGTSRSTRRLSARLIPPLLPINATSQSCFVPKASRERMGLIRHRVGMVAP